MAVAVKGVQRVQGLVVVFRARFPILKHVLEVEAAGKTLAEVVTRMGAPWLTPAHEGVHLKLLLVNLFDLVFLGLLQGAEEVAAVLLVEVAEAAAERVLAALDLVRVV